MDSNSAPTRRLVPRTCGFAGAFAVCRTLDCLRPSQTSPGMTPAHPAERELCKRIPMSTGRSERAGPSACGTHPVVVPSEHEISDDVWRPLAEAKRATVRPHFRALRVRCRCRRVARRARKHVAFGRASEMTLPRSCSAPSVATPPPVRRAERQHCLSRLKPACGVCTATPPAPSSRALSSRARSA